MLNRLKAIVCALFMCITLLTRCVFMVVKAMVLPMDELGSKVAKSLSTKKFSFNSKVFPQTKHRLIGLITLKYQYLTWLSQIYA